MRRAEETVAVTQEIYVWSAYEPSAKCDLSSTAVQTKGGLFLVDPIPLRRPALENILGGNEPAAILLTSANHLRAAEMFGMDFSSPLFASTESGLVGCGGIRAFESGLADLLGAPEVHAVGGAASGEVLFHFRSLSLVVLGDAIINLEPYGFMLLPDKYCTSPGEMRKSLRVLADLDFSVACFAHGTPLVTKAKQRLLSLLD